MNKILFFQTKCNIVCDYCHFSFNKDFFTGYGKAHPFGDMIGYKEILEGLEQFRPYHIEFTGGEPLLYKDFEELINNLPDDCQWAITSNTILNIDNINLDKCISWTASWHDKNETTFVENVIKLSKKCPASVSVVVPFNNVKNTLIKANEIRAKTGTRVNILRELKPGVSWIDTEEQKMLDSMPKTVFNVVNDDIPPSYKFEKGFVCSGGSDYICLMSDGQVFTCYSNLMDNKPIGNISTFKKLEGDRSCYDLCLGCAEDHKARKDKL